MFKFLKRIFCRPRLIERYEDLDAIIEAHNALIKKTLEIMRDSSVPPRYVLSRFNAIQDSEEKAVAAYWRNKKNKADVWKKVPKNSTVSDILQEKVENKPPEELTAQPPIPIVEAEVLPNTQKLEASEQEARTEGVPQEESGKSVIEIHINK